MFNWLKSLYNGAAGILGDIEKWITGALTVVYSYFEQLISDLWNSLNWLGQRIQDVYNAITSFIESVYSYAVWIVTVAIPDVLRWASQELNRLWGYLYQAVDALYRDLSALGSWAESELSRLGNWVVNNVLNPLLNDVLSIFNWIANEGAYVLYLLTHPDQLAAILGRYILGNLFGFAARFSKPLVRWLVQNMISETGFVSGVIEDIVSSLF